MKPKADTCKIPVKLIDLCQTTKRKKTDKNIINERGHVTV